MKKKFTVNNKNINSNLLEKKYIYQSSLISKYYANT